jgi:hypothetical protein
MVTVLNLPQELVPVAGAANVSLSVTGTAALLTAGVTIAAATNIVQVQAQGGNLRYTPDGTNPTTTHASNAAIATMSCRHRPHRNSNTVTPRITKIAI